MANIKICVNAMELLEFFQELEKLIGNSKTERIEITGSKGILKLNTTAKIHRQIKQLVKERYVVNS